jgi:hypothetical protein
MDSMVVRWPLIPAPCVVSDWNRAIAFDDDWPRRVRVSVPARSLAYERQAATGSHPYLGINGEPVYMVTENEEPISTRMHRIHRILSL